MDMFSIFVEEKIATIGMLTCFFVSILLRLLLAALYQRMIRETDNMATTNNKLLKQCKLKFSNCYQLNNGVSNVQVFVEKFMHKLSIGPFSFSVLYHLSGQFMLLSVVFAGIGVCRSIIAGSMFGEILPFYISTLINLYLYFSLSTILDIRGRRKVLKVNLIDYLENHLSCRMQMTREDLQMLYGVDAGTPPRGVEVMPIAGWIAKRGSGTQIAGCSSAEAEVRERETMRQNGQSDLQEGQMRTNEDSAISMQTSQEFTFPPLDPEESEELELLLKEILTLS